MPKPTDRERPSFGGERGSVTGDALCAAVDRIALDSPRGADATLLRQQALALIEQVLLIDEEGPRRRLLARSLREPGFAETLTGEILPAIAGRLGDGWMADRLSFVDVTIAAARIQDALRVLEGADRRRQRMPAAIAVVVPPWEQHTLAGAFLAREMRRAGAEALLVTAPTLATLAAVVARAPVSALMVTVGSRASRDRLFELAATLRVATPRALPIVAGGPGIDPSTDRAMRAGVDLLTSDPATALGFCKIPLSTRRDGILADA